MTDIPDNERCECGYIGTTEWRPMPLCERCNGKGRDPWKVIERLQAAVDAVPDPKHIGNVITKHGGRQTYISVEVLAAVTEWWREYGYNRTEGKGDA